MTAEHDFAAYRAVLDRVTAGIPAHREATRAEWMAVLRCARGWEAAVEQQAERIEALEAELRRIGADSMALGCPRPR